ncbi:MAG: GNAT family N-acetyltransferase [Bacteroidota bacterium]
MFNFEKNHEITDNNMSESIIIRPIKKNDDLAIAKIIRATLEKFSSNLEGTAYYDKETDKMFSAYADDKSCYYIALFNDDIVGGCGINRLEGASPDICELQKMYISPEARGKKIGKQLILKSLEFAKVSGYKKCYLETFPNMTAAIKLYKTNGFRTIDKPLGNTSHFSCDVWMLKEL